VVLNVRAGQRLLDSNHSEVVQDPAYSPARGEHACTFQAVKLGSAKILMSLHHIVFAAQLMAPTVLILPPAAPGQTPADSAPASTVDTSVADSASPGDSTRLTVDSLGARTSGAGKAERASDSVRAPVDSILKKACGSSGGSATLARDLLVIVFAPEAGRADRATLVKEVRGKLLGPVSSEPGAYYLRVPTGGQEHRLRAAADELVRSGLVRRVGSRACPSPAPADTSRRTPADTSRLTSADTSRATSADTTRATSADTTRATSADTTRATSADTSPPRPANPPPPGP
jgi:hypothetical protein